MSMIQSILKNRQALDSVDGLVESWLEENDVPHQYRMSIPFVLLYQVKRNEKKKLLNVSLDVGPLFNQPEGNC